MDCENTGFTFDHIFQHTASGQSRLHGSKWTISHSWQIVIEGTGILLEDELHTFGGFLKWGYPKIDGL